mmetsp:Transcript_76216/g.247285  ORF Transcript_76216/g.247285 Transcript_76216/m.247285 type:complete len:150 (-) Transcript_76216:106-555(-)
MPPSVAILAQGFCQACLPLHSRSQQLHFLDRAMQALPGYKTTYQILSPGSGGTKISKGCNATVHATGVVKETGKKFWSTKDPGQQPFSYQAGVGGVITGWDQGCLGMEIGEVRMLLIPADEGYGKAGFPAWGIPPGGTLEFTLECLQVK